MGTTRVPPSSASSAAAVSITSRRQIGRSWKSPTSARRLGGSRCGSAAADDLGVEERAVRDQVDQFPCGGGLPRTERAVDPDDHGSPSSVGPLRLARSTLPRKPVRVESARTRRRRRPSRWDAGVVARGRSVSRPGRGRCRPRPGCRWRRCGRALLSVSLTFSPSRSSAPRPCEGVIAATTKPVAREAMASMLRFFMAGSTAPDGMGHAAVCRAALFHHSSTRPTFNPHWMTRTCRHRTFCRFGGT